MKMNYKAVGVIVLSLMTTAVVTSCGGKTTEEPKSTETVQQEAGTANTSKSGFDVVGTLENAGSGDDMHFELTNAKKSFIARAAVVSVENSAKTKKDSRYNLAR